MLGCVGDWLGGLPLFFWCGVWGVFRGFLGVLTVFAFALVWCLALYSYWLATVLLDVVGGFSVLSSPWRGLRVPRTGLRSYIGVRVYLSKT